MNLMLEEVINNEIHIVKNLYSLYLHDLSRFTETLDISADGAFHFDDLDLLWNEEGFSPYFIKHQDDVIGFLLLLERPFLKKEYDFGINDIFILNKYRGKGFGKQSIETLFKEKRGSYFVIELTENQPAILFWKKIYQQLKIDFEETKKHIDDEPCLIQTFTIQ
ncbi:GNAT family N-acetyltransferase [Sporosarcina aquimarina]|uniref:GNAT family N-acetyltransferase n=1 Tax=Sporosarcina aquimarina TaxID=114975 RepID=UPI00203C8E0B|nr:GNAT family N-acetyltransferase [Sporosarcina aquimarina]MCM3757379.1 GNAT family N-acetyltransferase [Sporosarcina aquimarina]